MLCPCWNEAFSYFLLFPHKLLEIELNNFVGVGIVTRHTAFFERAVAVCSANMETNLFLRIASFFQSFFLISNNLLGVGMLSHSKRVGAVCRASTESRPRDVAAATHALLPVGCRITRLRIGWTKTTITILIYYVIYFIIYYMEPHALLPIRCRITRLRVGWTKTTTILSVINNHHYP